MIKPLCEVPEIAQVCADWAFDEWYSERQISIDLVRRAYKMRALNRGIPLTLVAMDGLKPIGMVSLKEDDLAERTDINPWLSSLYVLPSCRKKGYATRLVDGLISVSSECGLRRLFLFLGQNHEIDLESFYIKRGWRFYDKSVDNDGYSTKIFYYHL